MPKYDTLEYWMSVRDKENVILECLLACAESYNNDVVSMYTFCDTYKEHYEEYTRACQRVGELSECNADA